MDERAAVARFEAAVTSQVGLAVGGRAGSEGYAASSPEPEGRHRGGGADGGGIGEHVPREGSLADDRQAGARGQQGARDGEDVSDSRRESFEVGGRATIGLNLPSGEAAFVPGEPGTVEVLVEGHHADEFVVEESGGRISLRTPGGLRSRWDSLDVTVRTAPGTDVEVRAASADVGARVELGSLDVEVASGDLRVGDVTGNAVVRSASGDVEIGVVGGELAANTASGDLRLGEARGRAILSTASGDARLGSALAALSASTQSGDLVVGRYEGGDLECGSTSGDVRIGLPPGRALDVDLNSISGDIRSDFSTEPGGPPQPSSTRTTEDTGVTARLRVKTVSGDIALVRADGG